jgi:hypothetical protein
VFVEDKKTSLDHKVKNLNEDDFIMQSNLATLSKEEPLCSFYFFFFVFFFILFFSLLVMLPRATILQIADSQSNVGGGP